jgi:outer membrane lipase/esterase
MTTRRRWHISALAAAALIVAGCGGGDANSPLATRVVAFGDSLTDIGAYTPATQIPLGTLGVATGQQPGEAPYFGGKFTTNAHSAYACQIDPTTRALIRDPVTMQISCSNTSTASVWVEWIAARLGVAITPAQSGFGPVTNRRACPAAANPALANSCTGYAQGGSRVSNPAGIGNPTGTGGTLAAPTPMTIPMTEQVAAHLTRFTGFGSDDIVFVFGGNNDVFIQFGAVGQGLPQATALANLDTAANELVALVRDQIIANGAKRVAVMTLPDSSVTPFGASFGPVGNAQADGSRALLSAMSAQFNATLLAGLQGSGAKIIDARALNATVQASPASFGLTNVTTPACNAQIIAGLTGNRVTDGSSLFCNAAPASVFTASGLPISFNGLTPGASASTYLFADGVHPTTGGHKIFADQVFLKLKDFGWVPDNL